jgi:hypothetical protein
MEGSAGRPLVAFVTIRPAIVHAKYSSRTGDRERDLVIAVGTSLPS